MQSMSEYSMFQRLRPIVDKFKALDYKHCPYLLVPSVEEPTRLDEPHERHGWRNRDAGMISIRNSYAWHGEVSIAILDNIREPLRALFVQRAPITVDELHNNVKYRGQFTKPYPTFGLTGSEVARDIMRELVEQLVAEGYSIYSWNAEAGPARTPDRRVAITLYNLSTNHTCTVYCNIIEAEWQDPEIAAFRVKGTMFKSIRGHNFPAPDAGDIRCFFNDILPGLALNSAEEFKKKYDELVAADWSVHAFGNDGRFYKLIMVDPQRDRAKILFHRVAE